MDQPSNEQWRPVTGWEDRYEVSDRGNVRSVDRTETMSDGRTSTRSGRTKRTVTTPAGHLKVGLCKGGKVYHRYVHRLVLEAFVSVRPDNAECRHLDGDPANNVVENLAWGTKSENERDKLIHGTHHEAMKTHCPRGHVLMLPNLRRATLPRRTCLACDRAAAYCRKYRMTDSFRQVADVKFSEIWGGQATGTPGIAA